MAKILIQTGPLAATGVLFSAEVNDQDSISFKVNAIVGSTITVEDSADNSSWAAVTFGQNVSAGTPGVDIVTSGEVTAKGRYWFPATKKYIRLRVSTYVGPLGVDVDVDPVGQTLDAIVRPLETGLVATGSSSQANARPIMAVFNRFATVAANSGARLPFGLPGNYEVNVLNGGANALLVYPPVGYKINGGSTNAALSVAAAASVRLISDGAGNFWSF